MVAAFEECGERSEHGCHSRRKSEPGLRPFKGTYLIDKLGGIRIGIPRIYIARFFFGKDGSALFGTVKNKAGSQVKWYCVFPIGSAVGLFTDGLCLFVHVQFSSHKLSQSYGDMQMPVMGELL